MSIHFASAELVLHHGKCEEVMPTLPAESFDSVVCDPPYELTAGKKGGTGVASNNPNSAAGRSRIGTGFMNKAWDGTGIAYSVEMWREAYRVLKPGGYLLAFGGSRTFGRMQVAIEDAGFEIRDSIAWLYGSGFPKSMDVSKAIDKAAGATGEVDVTAPSTADAKTWNGWGTALKPAFEPIVVARKPFKGTVAQNVLALGTGALNIDACRTAFSSDADLAESTAKNQHATFGTEPGQNKVYGDYSQTPMKDYDGTLGRWPTNVVLDDSQALALGARGRLFPTFLYEPKAPGIERPEVDGESHATVKPLDLMRWLVRLVTRPGGLVLDPFAGSGTTGEAAVLEGMRAVLIEMEAVHLPLIMQRISKPLQQSLFDDLEHSA